MSSGAITPATIAVTKQLSPSLDPGRFDLKVGQTTVKEARPTAASARRKSFPALTA